MLPNFVISGGRRDAFALHLHALHHSCDVLFCLPRGEVTSALPFLPIAQRWHVLPAESVLNTLCHTSGQAIKGTQARALAEMYDNSCSRNLETVFRHSLERHRFCLNCAHCCINHMSFITPVSVLVLQKHNEA